MLERFKHITTLVFDVDGVLTDGSLLILENGLMARRMNIRDGYALQLAVKKGYHVLVISGGDSEEVRNRLHKLGVTQVWMKTSDKATVLTKFIQEHGLQPQQVLFMGDDMPDLPVLRLAGLPCCPADAAQEVKTVALYISPLKGGDGCVRDVIEKVLKLRNDWNEDESVRAQ